MVHRKRVWLLWVCLAFLAGNPAGAEEFARALPGKTFSFPQDHYSHPEFQTEWWYYTGHIQSRNRRSFGYQLTFFRTALQRRRSEKSRWALSTVFFAHFALTDETNKTFMFRERISRGALGQAGAKTDRLHVWVEDWSVTMEGKDHLLEARDPAMAIRLRLTPLKPPVVNGINGVSQKAEGEGYASHYYSITRMKTRGEVTLQGEILTVEGLTWMDHEFGSNQLRDYQVGWDWFSIQLENNTELMLYVIRHNDGKPDPYSSGTFITPDGGSRHLRLKEFEIQALGTWRSRKTRGRYPSRWRIRIPQMNIDLTVVPTVLDQELITQESTRVTYWEGSVKVSGTYEERSVSGVGYVELTGYAEPFGKTI
jgi:predicted secreted hydrolase